MADNNQPIQLVYGLDIGTRSIVGTVGYRKGKKFIVTGMARKEHETRAMLDGQIHDIQKVGDTIREVKAQLESGELHVFDASAFTIEGVVEVMKDANANIC